MTYYAGLDVSLKEVSICIIDDDGKVVAQGTTPADPEGVASWFRNRSLSPKRIVHESGQLSIWLQRGMAQLGLPAICIDARKAHKSLSARLNKSDSADAEGLDALADGSPRPGSVWNRIPDARRDDLIEFALEHEALSTRELAVKYTDEKKYFVSESSAYRILKAADLITAPDYVVIKAADEFKDNISARSWMTTVATSSRGNSATAARQGIAQQCTRGEHAR